jgi:hypothetical protein
VGQGANPVRSPTTQDLQALERAPGRNPRRQRRQTLGFKPRDLDRRLMGLGRLSLLAVSSAPISDEIGYKFHERSGAWRARGFILCGSRVQLVHPFLNLNSISIGGSDGDGLPPSHNSAEAS